MGASSTSTRCSCLPKTSFRKRPPRQEAPILYITYASIFIVIFRHIIITSTPTYCTIGDERDDGGILLEDNCDSSPLQKIQYDIPLVEQNRNTRKCIAKK